MVKRIRRRKGGGVIEFLTSGVVILVLYCVSGKRARWISLGEPPKTTWRVADVVAPTRMLSILVFRKKKKSLNWHFVLSCLQTDHLRPFAVRLCSVQTARTPFGFLHLALPTARLLREAPLPISPLCGALSKTR